MAPVVSAATASKVRPRVLVVDDEVDLQELAGDVVGKSLNCKLLTASTLAAAKELIESQSVDLVLLDLHLPDGDGMSLLPALRRSCPLAGAIVLTGHPSVDGAVAALRSGAGDFLPKPFTAELLADRVRKALARHDALARHEARIDRLRNAVKRLNDARKLVSKKVDLLCNDLVSAYGELSRQLDAVRTQESFRSTLQQAKDLEQMLCHAMDWMMRQLGYSNVAVWLATENQDYQLGAYMKYTVPGETAVSEALKRVVLPAVCRDGALHAPASEFAKNLNAAERSYLANQDFLGVNCTYLGESLAAVVFFRDARTPFTPEDLEALKAVGPIFATCLSDCVRGPAPQGGPGEMTIEDGDDDDGPGGDAPPHQRRSKRDDDWWKRGEPPPF